MGIWGQKTKLVNKTGLRIHFVVEGGGVCPLRDLPAGKSRSVSISLIRKHCQERGSFNWPIRVLIDNQFYGMRLHPRRHILKMTRVVFRFERRADASCTLIAEGVLENFRDRIFDSCINSWDEKTYVEIARADSTWRSIREVGEAAAEAAAPLIGTEQSRLSASWRKKLTLASSTINGSIKRLKNGGGRTAAPASVMNSGARNSTTAAMNSGQNSTMFVIFILAFSFIAAVHIYMKL